MGYGNDIFSIIINRKVGLRPMILSIWTTAVPRNDLELFCLSPLCSFRLAKLKLSLDVFFLRFMKGTEPFLWNWNERFVKGTEPFFGTRTSVPPVQTLPKIEEVVFSKVRVKILYFKRGLSGCLFYKNTYILLCI